MLNVLRESTQSNVKHRSDFKDFTDFPFLPALGCLQRRNFRPLEMLAKASQHGEPMLGWCCFQAAVRCDEIRKSNSDSGGIL